MAGIGSLMNQMWQDAFPWNAMRIIKFQKDRNVCLQRSALFPGEIAGYYGN